MMPEFPFDVLWPDPHFENVVRLVNEGLSRRDVPYAFIGSFAVLAHGIQRAPHDIDTLICGADRNRAVEALRELGFDDGSPLGTDDGGDEHEAFVLRAATGPTVDLVRETCSPDEFRSWARACPRVPAFTSALEIVAASPADIARKKVRRMYARDIRDLQDLLRRFPLRIDMARLDDINRAGRAGNDEKLAKWEKVKRALASGERWDPPEPTGRGRTIFDAMCEELSEPDDDLTDLRDPRKL